jgi:hypothetical protein
VEPFGDSHFSAGGVFLNPKPSNLSYRFIQGILSALYLARKSCYRTVSVVYVFPRLNANGDSTVQYNFDFTLCRYSVQYVVLVLYLHVRH